jgi:hypothetical protein
MKLTANALLGSGWSTGDAQEPSEAPAALAAEQRRRASRGPEEGLAGLIAVPAA